MRILVFLMLALIAAPAYSQITIGRYRVNGTIEFNADLQIEEVVPMTTIPDPAYGWNLDDNTAAYGGVDLTAVDSPTFDTGKLGDAMYCSRASNQYAKIANASAGDLVAAASDFTEGFTITGWVWLDSNPSLFDHFGICGSGDNFLSTNGWTLSVTQSFSFQRQLGFYVAGSTFLQAPGNLTSGSWNFVAFRWSPDGSGPASIFLNSATAAATSNIGSTPWPASTLDFNIGNLENGNRYLDGRIDALYIFNTALSDAQITALYNDGDGLELAPAPVFSGPLRVKSSAVYQNGSKNSATYQNGSIGGASVN